MQLDQVVPWGRSFDEYRRMFCLADADLAGSILGCGDGPASFNAEATALGHPVVSCDPIYQFSTEAIRRRVHETRQTIVEQARAHADQYLWSDLRDPDDLCRHRLLAMERFFADFEQGKAVSRYVCAALPHLPFPDNSFSLALVSHLLFLYSRQLNLEFHIESVYELLRIASEVRIFPLIDLDHHLSSHLGPVLNHLGASGHHAEVVVTPYEFQRAPDHFGNRMLRIRQAPSLMPPR